MKLSDFLEEKNIRQSHFARDLGISSGYLCDILKGNKRPSPDLAEQIELATGGMVTAMELLFPHRAPVEVAARLHFRAGQRYLIEQAWDGHVISATCISTDDGEVVVAAGDGRTFTLTRADDGAWVASAGNVRLVEPRRTEPAEAVNG